METLNADELITGCGIVSRIIAEEPGIEEARIDAALMAAYVKGDTAEAWETRTRMLLALAIAEAFLAQQEGAAQ